MKLYKNIIVIVVMVLTIIGSGSLNYLLKQLTIDSYNEQAKLELQHIKTCFNSVNGSVVDKLSKCASNSLVGGRTGDVFVINLKDMKLIWDNSIDCKTSKTMYLTKNSVCKLASNQESCGRLSKQIKLGYNGKYSWNFDDSEEHNNWIILPDEIHNFDGSSRATQGIKDQIVLVQGFQEDEVMTKYKIINWINKIITSIILILLSLLLLIQNNKYQRVEDANE